MTPWFDRPWVRIVLWLGAYAALGRTFGKFAWLVASPLVAYGIARPMIACVSDLRRMILGAVWLPVHGKHYVFRQITVRVEENDEGQRWVNLADVFKVVGNAVSAHTLGIAYPGQVADRGSPARPHMRVDALVTHLGTKNQPEALRFRTWVERSIAAPGRKVWKNLQPDRSGGV